MSPIEVKLEHLAILAAGRLIADDAWPPTDHAAEPSTDELRAFMAQLLGLSVGAPVPFLVPARDAWASISRLGNGRAQN